MDDEVGTRMLGDMYCRRFCMLSERMRIRVTTWILGNGDTSDSTRLIRVGQVTLLSRSHVTSMVSVVSDDLMWLIDSYKASQLPGCQCNAPVYPHETTRSSNLASCRHPPSIDRVPSHFIPPSVEGARCWRRVQGVE